MAGKHRAKKRQAEAYVWLGTGAVTLGLGVALSAWVGCCAGRLHERLSRWVGCDAVAGEFWGCDDVDPHDHQRAEREYVKPFIHARGYGRRWRDIGSHDQRIRCPTNESGGYRR